MLYCSELQEMIKQTYTSAFGTTPLRQRLEDIQGEVTEWSWNILIVMVCTHAKDSH